MGAGADAARRWRQKHPEAVREQKRKYYQRHKERLKTRVAAKNLARSKGLRESVLIVLGGCCVRCGFSDFRALQIDHINGGGGRERAAIKCRDTFNRKVLQDQTGYQLLCANCNWIKRSENREYRWRYAMEEEARIKSTSTITED